MGRVEYNINDSEFYLKIRNLKFFFSSEFNKTRFELNYEDYVEEENNKLKCRYHVNLDLTNILLVAFYKKIEKRGFKILAYNTNGGIIELNDSYIFKID